MTALSPVSRKHQLAEVRERKRAVRERIRSAENERDAARDALPDGAPDIHSESFRAAERAVISVRSAENDLRLIEDEERFLLGQISGVNAALDRTSWLHQPEVLSELQQLAHSKAPVGNMNLGPALTAEDLVAQIERNRMLAASGPVTTPPGAVRAPYFGAVQQQRRRLTLLDLIPTTVMELPIIPYLVEGGSFDTAAETSELAVKAEADITLTEAEAKAKTIAHWVKISRQSLADVAGLQVLLTERLTYGVLRRVESAVIAGDGTGENLTGLLHTSLVSEVEHVAGENVMDMTAEGLVAVDLLEGEPDGIAMNPRDYFSARRAKSTGSGEYLGGSPWLPTEHTLWDLPIVLNTAVPQGKAIVGDWGRGATLFVREGVNTRLSDQDQDDFVRNRCTLLGEGRFALAIWKPRSFAVVHLT